MILTSILAKVLLTTLHEGDIFGEMAIAGNQPRLASAVCKTSCILAVAHGENLDALVESNPEFTRALIKNFANRIHDSETIMLNNIKQIVEMNKIKKDFLVSLLKVLLINSEIKIKDKNLTVCVDMELVKKKFKLNKKIVSNLEKLLVRKDLNKIINMVSEIEIEDLLIRLNKYNVNIEI